MWHYSIDGAAHGPVSEDALIEGVRIGRIPGSALVWSAGMSSWEPLPARFPGIVAPTRSPRLWPAHVVGLTVLGLIAASQAFLADRISNGVSPLTWLNTWFGVEGALAGTLLVLAFVVVRKTPHAGHRFAAVVLYGLGGLAASIWTLSLRPTYAVVAQNIVEIGDYRMAVQGDHLFIEGAIGAGFSERLRDELDRHPGVKRIVITSPGGLTSQAEAAASMIQSHDLAIEIRDECSSACVTLLMAGSPRFATAGTAVGLHSVQAFDGLRPLFRKAAEEGYEDYYAFLSHRGLPDRYLEIARQTPSTSIHYVPTAELAADGVLTVHGASRADAD